MKSVTPDRPDGDFYAKNLYEESQNPTSLDFAYSYLGAIPSVTIQEGRQGHWDYLSGVAKMFCNRVAYQMYKDDDPDGIPGDGDLHAPSSHGVYGSVILYYDGKIISKNVNGKLLGIGLDESKLVYAIYDSDADLTTIYVNQLPYKTVKGDVVKGLGVSYGHIVWLEKGHLFYDNTDLGVVSEYDKGYVVYKDHISFILNGDDRLYFDGKIYNDYTTDVNGQR